MRRGLGGFAGKDVKDRHRIGLRHDTESLAFFFFLPLHGSFILGKVK